MLVVTSSAYAQSPPAAPTAPGTASAPQTGADATEASQSGMQERWYGWETLAMDAAWVGLVGIAVTAIVVDPSFNDEGAPNGVAIVAVVPVVPTYLLGAPIVHAAHGHWGKAGASLALRLGAPIALGYLGSGLGTLACPGKASETSNYHCVNGVTGFGAIAGVLTAIGVDALLLARERIPSRPSVATWSPALSLNRRGFSVGLGAEF